MVDSLLDSKLARLKHYIVISYPVNSMNFSITKEEKNKIFEYAREKTKDWLDKFIKQS